MTDTLSPEAVVQRQLDAYNARDLDALLATHAPDARQSVYPHPHRSRRGQAHLPEGTGTVEPVAMYEVADGKIQSQSVKPGVQKLDVPKAA